MLSKVRKVEGGKSTDLQGFTERLGFGPTIGFTGHKTALHIFHYLVLTTSGEVAPFYDLRRQDRTQRNSGTGPM